MTVAQISLYYKESSSDKVYNVQIIDKGSQQFTVDFSYGRRGSTLQTGTKTATPVALPAAQKVYDKLVAEKKGKGYSEGEEGTPYAGTDKAGQVSGLVPQLLNSIDIDRVYALLEDDDWFMQEKKDGFHQMIRVNDAGITVSNRKGLIVPASTKITQSIANVLTSSCVFDGETIGDKYVIFDLLEREGVDLRNRPAIDRYLQLVSFSINFEDQSAIEIVPCAITTADKKRMFERIEAERGEGVVFKKKNASYVPGRPNSGGNMLKYKFKGSATCQVIQQNKAKRSIEVGVVANDNKGWLQTVGNVTIPSNFEVPSSSAIIEVEYLYAFPGGSLFQPVYKGLRADKDGPDVYNTLKFKQGTEEES